MDDDAPPSNPSSPRLSRRAAVQLALGSGLLLGTAGTDRTTAATSATASDPFVPVDDYPYFGAEPNVTPAS